jgi:cytoskeletal protein CcmA (bactofilin family)
VTDGITVSDVTITGFVQCNSLHVEGTLAIKLGAKVNAEIVRYRRLIIEPGATLNARLVHLDEGKPA